MISRNTLKQMCTAPEQGKAYYRPFICKGDLSKADIFLVGINPATPIFPEQMGIDDYVDLLLNYAKFVEYYKASRVSQDKDEVSRTRIGMNSFLSWLSGYTDSMVLETDVIPYPTTNVKLLKKEPRYVREKGKDIFYNLVTVFKPSLLILHGKKTVKDVCKTLIKNGLISPDEVNIGQPIKELEQQAPILHFKYPNGKAGSIMACRHFMYYGNNGDTFEPFRRGVLEVLKPKL